MRLIIAVCLLLALVVGTVSRATAETRYAYSFSPVETEKAVGTTIDKIIIIGNYTTRAFVLLQEIPFVEGDTLTLAELQTAQEQIYNLQLFNLVLVSAKRFDPQDTAALAQATALPEQDSTFAKLIRAGVGAADASGRAQTVVLVSVHERWYLFPQPRFDLRGVSLTEWLRRPTIANVNFGTIISHQNLSGLSDPLSFSAGVGFDPYIQVSYYTPYLLGTSRTGFGGSLTLRDLNNLAYDTRTNTVPRYTQKTFTAAIFFGQRISTFDFLNLTIGYSRISVFDDTFAEQPTATVSGDGRDYFPFLLLNYTYNRVDFNQCPTKGFYLSATLLQNGTPFEANKINVTRAIIDLRWYRKLIGELSIGLRNWSVLTLDSPVPNHLRSFLGYSRLAVRGYTNTIFEGDNVQLNTAELRYPIIPDQTLTFDFMPFEQFKVLKWALYMTAFFDAGTTWYNPRTKLLSERSRRFTLENVNFGYGAGFVLVGGYRLAARVDFAVSDRGKFEIIFDNTVSF
ncbi:MAG: hypothetical protein HY22_08565 [[Candidatus Thermochlorobacteriaceae] bacterium GBChlB]|nr:MAG: hypothetical protein HY22_08565 [[Candidatus Thermochlorobacteriaceae] bacterium GBChlB]